MLKTRLTELFQIKYPIIQAGMVWTSGWKLAAATAENGCLGLIGSGSMKPELLQEHIQKIKNYLKNNSSNIAWGVNVALTRGDVRELVNVVLRENVKVVFTSAGNPVIFTKELKENGAYVVHVIASVKHALKSQEAGCDAVVAEGFEAGGHNGFDEITTMCLVPQVADALEIPVIAAGGIADGRQILAALSIGAEAVQIGTRFAATHESSCSDLFKRKITEAKDDSTILTLKKVSPVRMFKNKFALEADTKEKSGATKEQMQNFLGKKREMNGIFKGDLEEGELEMGQSSGLVHEIKSVKEVVNDLIREYNEAMQKLKKHDTC